MGSGGSTQTSKPVAVKQDQGNTKRDSERHEDNTHRDGRHEHTDYEGSESECTSDEDSQQDTIKHEDINQESKWPSKERAHKDDNNKDTTSNEDILNRDITKHDSTQHEKTNDRGTIHDDTPEQGQSKQSGEMKHSTAERQQDMLDQFQAGESAAIGSTRHTKFKEPGTRTTEFKIDMKKAVAGTSGPNSPHASDKVRAEEGNKHAKTPGGDLFWNASGAVAPTFGEKVTKPVTSSSSGSEGARSNQSRKTKPHVHEIKHKKPPATMYNKNLEFYQNRARSKPSPGYTIEEMLKWRGDYRQLEINHRYIQWLFPIPEGSGMNPEAQPLQDHEAWSIRESRECRGRLLKAYEMMLDFYGMELGSKATGEINRCQKNWKKRFAHLNKSGHNYLRITRIMKCLACCGLGHYQKPWIDFFLTEVFVTKQLSEIRHGAVIHWIDNMDDRKESQECFRLFQDLHDNAKGITPSFPKREVEESDSDNNEEPQQNTNKDPVESSDEDDDVKEKTQSINTKARERRRTLQIQNVLFYENKLKSKPEPGLTIKEMLKLKGKYGIWENQCLYIQWLFPNPGTKGVNEEAQELFPHEIQTIRGSRKIQGRFLQAYELMLDVYGMKLHKKTGEVSRAKHWEDRYQFLSRSDEDHRKITRIIRALECFGYVDFQYPWVSFLINEVYVQERLQIPIESVHVWISIMADDADKVACATTIEELAVAKRESVCLSDWNDPRDVAEQRLNGKANHHVPGNTVDLQKKITHGPASKGRRQPHSSPDISENFLMQHGREEIPDEKIVKKNLGF